MKPVHKEAISPENWLDVDERSVLWGFVNTVTGEERTASPDDWVSMASQVRLSDAVPPEIRRAFEVARALVAYGCFFYPLFNLALSELYRLAEVAITLAHAKAGGPESNGGMFHRIRWLEKQEILSEDAARNWQSIRKLRNSWTHSAGRELPPMWPLGEMERLGTESDALFDSVSRYAAKNDV